MGVLQRKVLEKLVDKLVLHVGQITDERFSEVQIAAIKSALPHYFFKSVEKGYNRPRITSLGKEENTSMTRAEIQCLDELARGGDKSPLFKVEVDPMAFASQDSSMFLLALDPNKLEFEKC